MESQIIKKCIETGLFEPIDIHFAKFMADKVDPSIQYEIFMAAALVSQARNQGHICLDLQSLHNKSTQNMATALKKVDLRLPVTEDWVSTLNRSQLVGTSEKVAPLMLDSKNRLYLFRYWQYQENIAQRILSWADEAPFGVSDLETFKKDLDQLFPLKAKSLWHKIASIMACHKKFAVISGGPGCGKTTTVASIIALISKHVYGRVPKIALCAPTGKAAARLQTAISQAKQNLNMDQAILHNIPEQATTIHRLLGTRPYSPYFRHNQDNLLDVDMVIVDEASMVDLALLSKLICAISPKSRLILMGDKDQLSSVEAGAALGDICHADYIDRFSKSFVDLIGQIIGQIDTQGPLQVMPKDASSLLCDCIVELKESFRFGSDSGIAAISQAVNTQNTNKALNCLISNDYKDITYHGAINAQFLADLIETHIIEDFIFKLKGCSPDQAFAALDRFRILCAVKNGPFGVFGINQKVRQFLIRNRIIGPKETWYPYRPVIITQNDYQLGLFNGDVGISLPDPLFHNELRVYFQMPDETYQKFHPAMLPACESIYAMTIHKSQGSEFDHVVLVLPDRDSAILSRELLYTGITRAKQKVDIWGDKQVIDLSISRKTQRYSGLKEQLW